MSSKILKRYRLIAYKVQAGLCFYCQKPMWCSSLEAFATVYNVSISQARLYQCTAEHLDARQDGGKDARNNIVAACRFCNKQRHVLKKRITPLQFQKHVQKRIIKNSWPTARYLKLQ